MAVSVGGWIYHNPQQVVGQPERWVTLRQGSFEYPTWIPWYRWEMVEDYEDRQDHVVRRVP